jgi:hypothetical protein
MPADDLLAQLARLAGDGARPRATRHGCGDDDREQAPHPVRAVCQKLVFR